MRKRQAARRRGVLTFEWILAISLLVIGVIGGLSAVRNAILDELSDLAGAIQAIDIMSPDSSNGHHSLPTAPEPEFPPRP